MKRKSICGFIVVLLLILFYGNSRSDTGEIFVEIVLSPERQEDRPVIRGSFEQIGIKRVRIQLHRLGISPKNIAIGKDIPVSVAQHAISLALKYNDGIHFLLPEYRFFKNQIAIGSSAFDEQSQIPVSQDALQKLIDPALTTKQFHTLYRHLTGEDVRFR